MEKRYTLILNDINNEENVEEVRVIQYAQHRAMANPEENKGSINTLEEAILTIESFGEKVVEYREVKFTYLECVIYTYLEEAIEYLNHGCEEDTFTMEDIGREVVGEMITYLKKDDEVIATFILSGANSNGYILRCVSVDGEYSSDG